MDHIQNLGYKHATAQDARPDASNNWSFDTESHFLSHNHGKLYGEGTPPSLLPQQEQVCLSPGVLDKKNK